MFTESKRRHTHDVRALTLATFPGEEGPSLVSVGNDARFLVHSVANFTKACASPFKSSTCTAYHKLPPACRIIFQQKSFYMVLLIPGMLTPC